MESALVGSELKKYSILFDLDGTIIDSSFEICEILSLMRQDRMLSKINLRALRAAISRGGKDLIEVAFGEKSDELLREFRDRYSKWPLSKNVIYPGLEFTLNRLKKDGFCLAVCTNKPQNLAVRALKERGLLELFEGVYGMSSSTLPKPSPQLIERALDSLTCDNATLVGDSPLDYQAAVNAGVNFVFFSGGYHKRCEFDGSLKIVNDYFDYENFKNIIWSNYNEQKRNSKSST